MATHPDLPGRRALSTVRMLVRLAAFIGWTLVLLPVQFLLIRLRGDAKQRLPMVYWRGVARILGLRLATSGTLASGAGRPVIFVANHSSWLDIVALGATLPACFIAKGEIARWPGISAVAQAGRTVFVTRRHRNAGRERHTMEARLEAGDNLILFPEGTTSDGAHVLPFHAAFLALAYDRSAPVIQPVTLVYDLMDGLPICRRNRPLVSWYGDMNIAPHYARLGRHNWRASIVLGEPVPATGGRKAITAQLETRIAEQAARIRQGRMT